jgi:hypothetical protein
MTRFVLLTIAISLAAMISTMVSVHLLTILQARGIALSSAVALGALVGPSQVLARFIEMSFHRYFHPIWTKLAATSLVAGGLGLMTAGFPILAIPSCSTERGSASSRSRAEPCRWQFSTPQNTQRSWEGSRCRA